MSNWMGVRAYARHRGDRHAAVQKAIKTGRISEDAIKREATGRILVIDQELADAQWAANTDPTEAAKSGKVLIPPVGNALEKMDTAAQALPRGIHPPRESGALPIDPAVDVEQGSAAPQEPSTSGHGAGDGGIDRVAGAGDEIADRAAGVGGEIVDAVRGAAGGALPGQLPLVDVPSGNESPTEKLAAGTTDPRGTPAAGKNADPHGFYAARANREGFNAKQAELDYLKAIGLVISSADQARVSSRRYRALRDKLQSIPDRTCDVLAVEKDASTIHAILTKEINQVLHELSDDARAEVARGPAERVAA